ncbi:hypothetical protein V6N11_059458 [Hibiscus sabdariffa]|uniref:Transmembrane protein n=1 Tax=Hibiscus sabdariffa TaxID=183260 RepID=A0ABR1ZU75_9ROSI
MIGNFDVDATNLDLLFAYILWNLWKRRNDVVFKSHVVYQELVLQQRSEYDGVSWLWDGVNSTLMVWPFDCIVDGYSLFGGGNGLFGSLSPLAEFRHFIWLLYVDAAYC